ncbi:MAG: hypothetical protein KatS3mg043_1160 [Rhodothermaceae bacterium]|nr:MAG: hypothetical protein KatS3mg043_1160 [Rhodothermaceae bacterium]
MLGLTGCLPHACNRIESRALLPADSLSRALAATLPVDTLRLQWQVTASDDVPMAHPRTVRFGPDGRIYVADTERHHVLAFTGDGALAANLTGPDFEYPYLAGWRGDTLVVFHPMKRRADFLVEGAVVRAVTTPGDLPKRGTLQYLAATGRGLYLKVLGEDFAGYLARLDDRGRIAERYPLPGPAWRHAGLLRTRGDTVLSLAGFTPAIDVLTPDGRLDSLALTGFDSPMLPRRRLFLLGETHEPPLLTASADAAGDYLFVLNMRPGWLRVDVYDAAGRLQHILTQENPAFNQEYYPADLAVRRTADGAFEIAVLASKPAPMLTLYRWHPGAG